MRNNHQLMCWILPPTSNLDIGLRRNSYHFYGCLSIKARFMYDSCATRCLSGKEWWKREKKSITIFLSSLSVVSFRFFIKYLKKQNPKRPLKFVSDVKTHKTTKSYRSSWRTRPINTEARNKEMLHLQAHRASYFMLFIAYKSRTSKHIFCIYI